MVFSCIFHCKASSYWGTPISGNPHIPDAPYGIFTDIWVIFGVNIGKYSIHGAYGYGNMNIPTLLCFVGASAMEIQEALRVADGPRPRSCRHACAGDREVLQHCHGYLGTSILSCQHGHCLDEETTGIYTHTLYIYNHDLIDLLLCLIIITCLL